MHVHRADSEVDTLSRATTTSRGAMTCLAMVAMEKP